MKGGNSLLIHRMHLDDHYVVLDVNSGAVHIIDKMIYDILGFYDGNNPEETKAHFKGKYADSDVEEVLAELKGTAGGRPPFSRLFRTRYICRRTYPQISLSPCCP